MDQLVKFMALNSPKFVNVLNNPNSSIPSGFTSKESREIIGSKTSRDP